MPMSEKQMLMTENEKRMLFHVMNIVAAGGLLADAVKKGIYHDHGLNNQVLGDIALNVRTEVDSFLLYLWLLSREEE